MTPRGSRLNCCLPVGPISLRIDDLAERITDRIQSRGRALTVFVQENMVYAVSPDSTILRDLTPDQYIGCFTSRIRHDELVEDIQEWRG